VVRWKPRSWARAALALSLALPVAGLAACSISASSESISKSVSSPFKSSSDSSSGGPESAYFDEVRSYTAGFATSAGDVTNFRRGIGSIAERRGIHDWEDDDATCKAIGQGLKQAQLTQEKAQALLGEIFAGRQDRAAVALKGFQE
jgi:hypothetical protein